ncbi:MAG TPA: hypothetical protein VHU92_12100 [Streptosporangiaceae bacterium]|jgi:hypothetical protein|nr:hypothetical protein [Streptosporangiaceae bacterium]
MAEIVISLLTGPDGQPVGRLRRASGRTMAFTGWLELIRALEQELEAAAADPSSDG